MKRGTRSFRGAAVVVGAILLGLLSTAPVAAAHIPGLLIEPAFGCVSGPWTDGTNVTFTLKTADGALKKQVNTIAAGGRASACFAPPIVPGERITVKVGSTTRTLSVPKLSLGKLDRVHDVIAGAGPSGKEVRITINRCPPSSSRVAIALTSWCSSGWSRAGPSRSMSATRWTCGARTTWRS